MPASTSLAQTRSPCLPNVVLNDPSFAHSAPCGTLKEVFNHARLAAIEAVQNTRQEALLMHFTSASGSTLRIDPLNQASIDTARSLAPGEGIRSAVSIHIVGLIGDGLLSDPQQLPSNYSHLAPLIGWSARMREALGSS